MATATQGDVAAESRRPEAARSMQLVGFRLGEEEYGIEITKVQEIVLLGEITRLPETPPYLKGVMNLRNTVIPMMDLRLRFGLPEQPPTDQTRVIVVKVGGRTMGFVVDAVSEVLRVTRDQITPPPPSLASLGREYLTGLVRRDKDLLVLLDIDKVLSHDQREAAEAMAAS